MVAQEEDHMDGRRSLFKRTVNEVEEHMKTLVPYRSWWVQCVTNKNGRNGCHDLPHLAH